VFVVTQSNFLVKRNTTNGLANHSNIRLPSAFSPIFAKNTKEKEKQRTCRSTTQVFRSPKGPEIRFVPSIMIGNLGASRFLQMEEKSK
jgi:hypothetical protein